MQPVIKTEQKRKVGDGTPGPGRPKGLQNKTTVTIREAILKAFDKAGGADYLARMADEQPAAFMSLLSKVLPTQINLGTKADGIKIVVERATPANGDDAKVIDIKPSA